MKLKYRFVVRAVGGKKVAVAVGTDNEKFNGIIKLNETGELIFNMLNSGDVSEREIVKALMDKYSVDEETAKEAASIFINNLTQNGLLK